MIEAQVSAAANGTLLAKIIHAVEHYIADRQAAAA
jgi:hypothetical protein